MSSFLEKWRFGKTEKIPTVRSCRHHDNFDPSVLLQAGRASKRTQSAPTMLCPTIGHFATVIMRTYFSSPVASSPTHKQDFNDLHHIRRDRTNRRNNFDFIAMNKVCSAILFLVAATLCNIEQVAALRGNGIRANDLHRSERIARRRNLKHGPSGVEPYELVAAHKGGLFGAVKKVAKKAKEKQEAAVAASVAAVNITTNATSAPTITGKVLVCTTIRLERFSLLLTFFKNVDSKSE